ncbi:MAG: hypothetical protein HYU31_09200 [Deltaproteobacteria bacterium]|nr:hypothetical protein [Deltaproteobacteria bacterium]MBI2180978.1 hypothetical protein [Deltaproteobacteria bacterium]MBI2227710.1 hypothetical protein [Deltaproteobacteria bacterium]MBI2368618.1 hypothetical protein [Deltaproteobacteria bacterium]
MPLTGQRNAMNPNEKIAASFRELIAAAGELAFEYAESDNDGRRLARLALIEFLRSTPKTLNLDSDFSAPATGRESLH